MPATPCCVTWPRRWGVAATREGLIPSSFRRQDTRRAIIGRLKACMPSADQVRIPTIDDTAGRYHLRGEDVRHHADEFRFMYRRNAPSSPMQAAILIEFAIRSFEDE